MPLGSLLAPLGSLLGPLCPKVKKIPLGGKLGEEFVVQIGPHFGSTFRYKKNRFWAMLFDVTFSAYLLSFDVALGHL